MSGSKTMVGEVHPDILAFTAGRDAELDQVLVEADCIGSAAHARMLADLAMTPAIFSEEELDAVIAALIAILRSNRAGAFSISVEDQDVHLAVERELTTRLGSAGKRIHTARSRNDQIAVDLRLYAKQEIIALMMGMCNVIEVLLNLAGKYRDVPMVGRTHLQPAMPSSVGVWASAHAESVIDDLVLLDAVFKVNDRCPLGSAAGYGVPLPIDRALTAQLLGFSGPIHNVLYASSARGKCEAAILSAVGQVMLSLCRLAEDMILFMMPEFGYFSLPATYCTGSSIMPQKQNPDVFELIRARTAKVLSLEQGAAGIVKGLASGYSRDLQEVKPLFLEGMQTAVDSVNVLTLIMPHVIVHSDALRNGFRPGVYAADRALELVAKGMPFRDAYDRVKADLDKLDTPDCEAAIARKTHEGAPAGLDLDALLRRSQAARSNATEYRRHFEEAISKLLGINYPNDL